MKSKDWVDKDFYAVLGVDKTAPPAEIKKAYRRLARELHPDRNPGNAQAEERFKAASEAYDVLSDERQRREYDDMRSLFGSGAFRRQARSGTGTPFDFSDLFGYSTTSPHRFSGSGGAGGFGDVFSSLFTGGGGSGRPTASRGRDVETEVILNFTDAAKGVTLPITLRAPGACDTCKGTGAKPGTSPRACDSCRGTGMTTSNQGSFSFAEPCRDCQGTGTVVDTKCPECNGMGGVTKTRTMNVRIPSGVMDGQRIRLAGRGQPGERGGPAGDLNILVKVRKDDFFGQKNLDLTVTLPVSYIEAVLGADIRVPTLDKVITVRVPPATPSGRTLRVRGRGIRRADGKVGDLLVTIEVHIPDGLSEQARKALETYASQAPKAPREHLNKVIQERIKVTDTSDIYTANGSNSSSSMGKGERRRRD